MASPWHRPDAASGVSDLDRLRRLVDTDTLPPRKELQAQFPDRAWRDIVRRVKYLKNPTHPDTPLSFRISDRHPTPRVPKSLKPILNEQIRLPGPSALVMSDCHLPYHDEDFIQKCIDLALSWGIDTVVLNGDLIDCESFSKFIGDPESTFEEEMVQTEEMLEYLATVFAQVVWSMGNHEQRVLGPILKRELKVSRFLRMFTDRENVRITAYEWTEMESPLGLWGFVHPMVASIIAGRVPTVIASRRFTDRHIVSAHGHLWSLGRTEDGNRWAADSGGCFNNRKIAYTVFKVGNRPVMVQGAVIIKEGYPYMLSPQMDWDAMKRMYPAA